MPELPEVEVTRRAIAPHVENEIIENIQIHEHRFRWPIIKELPDLINGQKVESLTRRGKYLIFKVAGGHILIHLGMSGSLRLSENRLPEKKHDHVGISMSSGWTLWLNDPRRFGSVLWTKEPVLSHKLLSKLGPEPLTDDFTAETFYKASRNRKGPVKAFIMDSHIVVGVGNIYASESLFMARINPMTPANEVALEQYSKLVECVKLVLEKSIKSGGTTLKDFMSGEGKPGYFQQSLSAYGREGANCVSCDDKIIKIVIGQRATFYCPSCQI